MAKNNNRNNGCHKVNEKILINCFVFVATFSFANGIQFSNDSNYRKFNRENTATNCFMVTVPGLDGLTKNFGHYALLKFFPSDHQDTLFTVVGSSCNIIIVTW